MSVSLASRFCLFSFGTFVGFLISTIPDHAVQRLYHAAIGTTPGSSAVAPAPDLSDDQFGLSTSKSVEDGVEFFSSIVQSHDPSDAYHRTNGSVSEAIARKVRVLCWVVTCPNNHRSKARHVHATWLRRCDGRLFVSSAPDADLLPVPVLRVDVEAEGRQCLWTKTQRALQHIYRRHLHQFDWFLKADDDTYVVVENLRFMLLSHDPRQPLYFGCRFKPHVDHGYMSGGAGYVLSREAVRRFFERGVARPDSVCARRSTQPEDLLLGRCMQQVGVRAGDSRDAFGRHRFLPFTPAHHTAPRAKDPSFWFWSYIYHPIKQGMGCCSDFVISFHYMTAEMMYMMEYLLYHVHPYGFNVFPNASSAFGNDTEASIVEKAKNVSSALNSATLPF